MKGQVLIIELSNDEGGGFRVNLADPPPPLVDGETNINALTLCDPIRSLLDAVAFCLGYKEKRRGLMEVEFYGLGRDAFYDVQIGNPVAYYDKGSQLATEHKRTLAVRR